MNFDDDTVKQVAHLARIAISDEKIPHYSQELSNILTIVETLQKIDVQGTEPWTHGTQSSQRLRPDEVSKQINRDQLQQGAPLAESGLYLVPKVVDNE